jgi:hypothetical protein
MSYSFVARSIFVGVTAVAIAGTPAAAHGPSSAAARGSEAFVEVTPSTVQSGEKVDIQASCDGNDRQATVRSDAFGRASVRPDNGLLTGSATVPDRKPPDTYDVILTCGNNSTANTTLTVVNMSKATRGPATGAGGTAGGLVSPLVLTGGLGAIAVSTGVVLLVRGRRGAGSGD